MKVALFLSFNYFQRKYNARDFDKSKSANLLKILKGEHPTKKWQNYGTEVLCVMLFYEGDDLARIVTKVLEKTCLFGISQVLAPSSKERISHSEMFPSFLSSFLPLFFLFPSIVFLWSHSVFAWWSGFFRWHKAGALYIFLGSLHMSFVSMQLFSMGPGWSFVEK